MAKKRRTPKAAAARNGTDPGPIEQAIDKAAEGRKPFTITLLLNRQPVRMKPGRRLAVKQSSDPNEAELLVRGADNLWPGVLLPPGATFELREAGPAAALWTPPGTAK